MHYGSPNQIPNSSANQSERKSMDEALDSQIQGTTSSEIMFQEPVKKEKRETLPKVNFHSLKIFLQIGKEKIESKKAHPAVYRKLYSIKKNTDRLFSYSSKSGRFFSSRQLFSSQIGVRTLSIYPEFAVKKKGIFSGGIDPFLVQRIASRR